MKKKSKKNDFPHNAICFSCAKERGCKWPKGHCATSHYDTCPYCKRDERPLTALNDWILPGAKAQSSWD